MTGPPLLFLPVITHLDFAGLGWRWRRREGSKTWCGSFKHGCADGETELRNRANLATPKRREGSAALNQLYNNVEFKRMRTRSMRSGAPPLRSICLHCSWRWRYCLHTSVWPRSCSLRCFYKISFYPVKARSPPLFHVRYPGLALSLSPPDISSLEKRSAEKTKVVQVESLQSQVESKSLKPKN
jgi:hypothetical protein